MPHLHERDPVLDLGCGCGVPICQELAQLCRVTGVDISPVQIERARKLVPDATFERGDMSAVCFPDASFAAIVSLFAIIHLPAQEHRPLFDRLFTWLRPRGYLLASLGHRAWTGYEENWYGAPMFWSHPDELTSLEWVYDAGFDVLWQEFLPEGPSGGHRIILAQRSS